MHPSLCLGKVEFQMDSHIAYPMQLELGSSRVSEKSHVIKNTYM